MLMIALGAIPGKAQALSTAVYDKLLHFLAYALLSSLVYSGLEGRPARRALRTVAIVGALGALDEMVQALMPYREANWIDWKVDMMAAVSSVLLLMLLFHFYSVLNARTAEPEPLEASVARADRSE